MAICIMNQNSTVSVCNLDRLAAWFAKRPLAPTRTSNFAALAA